MAREDLPHRSDKPKRQPEPDREGQRPTKDTGERARDWPGDKEMDPVRKGEKRK